MSEGPAPRSQTDVVVEGIKTMLRDGSLSAGQRLPVEAELARLLGVSRGPLREGVRALSVLGVLETRQGAGTYVTALDSSLLLAPLGFLVDLQHPEGTGAVHAVRRVLETEAAAAAAGRITDAELAEVAAALAAQRPADGLSDPRAFVDADIAFHQAIAEAAGNPVLAALVRAFAGRTLRVRVWRATSDEGAIVRTLDEHRAVLRALQARDPERARAAMAHHLFGLDDFVASLGKGAEPAAEAGADHP